MIRIVDIAISGQCDLGAFSGSIAVGNGLQVITGPNRFGKSLVFASITWCLGVEQIYGVQVADNAIFPDAVRRALEVDGKRDVPVQRAEARLVLRRSSGETLTLTRAIVGGDAGRIHYDDGTVAGELRVGWGASSDGTAGFQAQFRQWAGLPEYRLVRTQGGEYPIYLENLAPLYLIEQLRGWTSVQAEQVYRYGLQEVADAAFESLLGLDDRLRARLKIQRARMQVSGLREEARVLAEKFVALLAEQGWVGALPAGGSDIAKVADRWDEQKIEAYVDVHFSYRFAREQELLQKRFQSLKQTLTEPSEGKPSSASAEASQQLIELKTRRDRVQRQIGTLRSQMAEHAHLLLSVDERLRSAKDLQRLKVDGLGILPTAECPTCQQTIVPAAFQLDEQSTVTISEHIDSLDRQRRVLKQGIERIKTELVAASAEDRRDAEALDAAERALMLTQHAAGAVRERAVKIATEIIGVERDLERNRQLQNRLDDLQRQITSWIERARGADQVDDEKDQKPSQIQEFEQRLRANVAALGVGGLSPTEAEQVRLGEHYEAMLGQRSLPAYGSASDRARLVLSYVLALLEAGSQHIGFVVLDEPIQQNPDATHRVKLVDFLSTFVPADRQVLLFTSLNPEECAKLVEKDVSLRRMDGKFLRLVPPIEPSPDGSAKVTGEHGAAPPTAAPTGSPASSVERVTDSPIGEDSTDGREPEKQD